MDRGDRGDRKSYGPGRRDEDLDQQPQLQADDHRLNGLRNGGVASSGSSSSAGHEEPVAGKGSDRTGPSKRPPPPNERPTKSGDAGKDRPGKAPSPTNAAVNGSGDKAPAAAAATQQSDPSSRPSNKATAAAPAAKKESKVQGR